MIVVYAIWLAVILLLGAAAWITLYITLHAWRTPRLLEATRFRGEGAEPVHSYSLIVPARHEESVLEGTLERLMGLRYPNYEVICVVGDDDPGTHAIADEVASRYPGRMKVVVDSSDPKNKPKALNTALPFCTGDIVGIFDAEDVVHPDVLSKVEQSFHADGADVVQGGVQLMNYQSSWFSVRNVLEYYFWFRSRLHFHSDVGFIPLGGNTVFVKSGILRRVGGWDPESLTEDCDLGTKLSAEGAKVVVAYDPELATREETPDSIGALVRQRTRWNQGFLQVFRKGDWKKLKGGQKALAMYTLGFPIIAALAALMIPVALFTAFALDTPIAFTMLLFAPLVPIVALVVSEVIGLRDFCREYGLPARFIDYFWVLVGTIPYWLVLGYAAARAVAREMTGTRNWEKTAHLGSHVETSAEHTAQMPAAAGGSSGPAAQTMSAMSAAPPDPATAGAGTEPGRNPYPTATATGGPDDIPPPLDTSPPPPSNLAVAGGGALAVRNGFGAEATRRALFSVPSLVVAALVIILAVIEARGAGLAPAWFGDEGQFVNNAWAVENWEGLSNYTYFYDHPPLGWITVAGWAFVTGAFERTGAIAAGREVALIAHIANMVLLYVIGRRLGFRPLWAALAIVLFTLSPLAFEFHRAVWLDNLAMPWALLSLALALSPKQSLWSFAGSGAALAAATLSKETCLLLLPVILVAAWMNADRRTRAFCLGLFFSFLGTLLAGWLLYAALRGELFSGSGHVSLVDGLKFQLFDRESSGSVFDGDSVAYDRVSGWLDTDAWLLAGVLLTPIALLWRNLRPVGVALAIYLVVLALPGYLPESYVIAVLPFAALAIAGTLELLSRTATGLGYIAAIGLVIVGALLAGPSWYDANRDLINSEAAAPQKAATDWVASNVAKDSAILTDDAIWTDLVEAGFTRERVHPFHKPDLDSAVGADFGAGADFDYVISTRAVREGLEAQSLPIASAANDAAAPVTTFGSGEDRVEIRRVGGG